MRCRSALLASLAGLVAARPAIADDDPRATFGLGGASADPGGSADPGAPARPADPRDVFGLGGPRARGTGKRPTCDDGRTFGCETALDPLDDVSPTALRTWLPASYLLRLPVGDARADAVAHYALGASRDDVGPVFRGATGLENLWTIEGTPTESLRTGNSELRVPITFMDTMLVVAGGFSARDRTSTGGVIDVRLRRGGEHHELDAYAWGSLTASPDRVRPIARGTYQLRRLSIQAGPSLTSSVVGSGPLPSIADGRTWYAAGLAPGLSSAEVRWRTATVVDANEDGVPDGLPGIVELNPVLTSTETPINFAVPYMARAGWERGAHAVEATLIGSVNREQFFYANATQQAAGLDRMFWIGDVFGVWRGTWEHTRATARLAWYRSARRESARDSRAADRIQLQTSFVPKQLDEEPALAAICDDLADDDPLPATTNCPVPFGFFLSGGAGLLTDSVGDRPSASVDVAHRIGHHVLRAGGVFEDARLVQTARYTGGQLQRSLFDGHVDRARFYAGDCPEDPLLPCAYTDESKLAYRTRYAAAYVEDTFQLAPNIRVDGGLRWELMWVGPRLHLSNQLAPRVGLAWDVLGNGSSRLFGSLGRSFVMVPAGVGPTIIARPRIARDVETPFGPSRTVDQGGVFGVAEGLKPAAQDEAVAGFEVGRVGTARAAIWLQGTSLRRGYETVLSNPETFELELDNPGRLGGTPARRNATVLALEVSTDPDAQTVIRASYLYGRTVGSWTGPYDPRQGQILYAGTDWDLEASNYIGALPQSPGHRFFLEAQRRGRLGPVELGASTRLTVASGRPRNVLADTSLGVVYLLERGAAGRGPTVSQANLRLAARWRGFDLTLDIFNLFDRETPLGTDDLFAGGTVRPIIGGDQSDLVFLKAEDGGPPTRRGGFGLASTFQAPIAATLGIHRAF